MSGLPVFATVLQAWDEVRKNFLALIRSLFVPAFAIGLLDAIGSIMADSTLKNFLLWVLTTPFYVQFAVICHRTVILGPQSIPSAIGLFWSERETRFLGWTIALVIVIYGAGIVIGLVGVILPTAALGFSMPWLPMAVMGFLVFYFYTRFMLVFPATAVDQATSLSDAWYLTVGHGLRIMVAVVISALPVALVSYAVSAFTGDGKSITTDLLVLVLDFAVLAIAICTVSVAYRTLADLNFIADATR